MLRVNLERGRKGGFSPYAKLLAARNFLRHLLGERITFTKLVFKDLLTTRKSPLSH
jgi:hypothetical protein